MCQKFIKNMRTIHLIFDENFQNRTFEHLKMNVQI